MTDYWISFGLIFCAFSFFMGYIWGNSKKGSLVDYTNELPNGYMKVICTDKVSSVLEEISVGKKRFLVSTEVFGQSVRPGDTVRKIKDCKEAKNLGIKVPGYPPLIKEDIL